MLHNLLFSGPNDEKIAFNISSQSNGDTEINYTPILAGKTQIFYFFSIDNFTTDFSSMFLRICTAMLFLLFYALQFSIWQGVEIISKKSILFISYC